MKIRYFDHAATTSVKEEVLKEMLPYFSIRYGNASSIYGIGRQSKKAVEQARERVAEALNCSQKEIYFTSCGTESDNLAIKGIAYANKEKGRHIITSKIEHPAVLQTCETLESQGYKVTYLDVDKEGIILLDELKSAITDETILISVMFANNEIGTIQPIKEIGKIAREHGVLFHTDAVQAIGNVKINVEELNIDLLSLSAHKFYGPKGIGALYVREDVEFERTQDGGHQEKNKRSGTENVAGIVGLGKAIQLSCDNFEWYNKKLLTLRDYYISQIEEKIPNAKLNGHRTQRLPGNANISIPSVQGEALLLNLDNEGICISTGSACTSGSLTPSHVLTAIGLSDELAQSSIRVTIGDENTKEDINFLIDKIIENVNKLAKK